MPAPIERTFDYLVPADWPLLPGMRVSVPFSGRQLVGIVVEIADEPADGLDFARIRAIHDCLDREALLPPAVLALTRQVAQVYLAGWGEVLPLAVPGRIDAQVGRRLRLTEAGLQELAQPSLTDSARLTDGAVSGGAWPDARVARHRPLGEGAVELLVQLGSMVEAGRDSAKRGRWLSASRLSKRRPGGVAQLYELARRGWVDVEDEWSGPPPGRLVAAIRLAAHVDSRTVAESLQRAPAQRRLIELLAEPGLGPRALQPGLYEAEAVERAGTTPATVRALVDKGLVERLRRPRPRTAQHEGSGDGAGTFRLTADQAAALVTVREAITCRDSRPILLHGVTGSGKTEVYLRAAAGAVTRGRTALLLVPEIGLTPQLERRARAVLGDRVAVWHSGLSGGERLEAFWRARRGEAAVVIGPRSALFAPLDDVGLIVVDEEQDSAYKQEERPRYQGRDVAIWRARLEGAAVVLGSATPAIESYYRATHGAKRLAEMPARVGARPLPSVELVDMRSEWLANGRTLVSETLEEAIGERLPRREQVLVLLNRRGFASSIMCRACGERLECPDCAVTLTLHRGEGRLRCHYCDHSRGLPRSCPTCGSRHMHDLGIGTERLQGAIEKAFPSARVGRFDADETRGRGAHARILADFAAHKIDVLVGTQMLAKGHDFPAVTLVGVVGADASLSVPDFRSSERTFQLLTQMAGRTGRSDLGGQVVMQALQPDHYAIEAALEHDYHAFYAREIEYRRSLRYPPFCRIAVCVCRGALLESVREEAASLAAALREVSSKSDAASSVDVLGPAAPLLSRLRGRYRMQVLLKAGDRGLLLSVLAEARALLATRKQVPRELVIDVDPMSLM